MRHRAHKRGPKILLLLVCVLGVYLAFFGFNVQRAIEFTAEGVKDALSF